MNEKQALRVLGLEAGADDEEVRAAFTRQLRQFRAARKTAEEPALQQRLDRALAATVLARRELLGPLRPAVIEATQELPAQATRRPALVPSLAVLVAGVLLVLFGVLRSPQEATTDVVTSAPVTREPEASLTADAGSTEDAADAAREDPDRAAEEAADQLGIEASPDRDVVGATAADAAGEEAAGAAAGGESGLVAGVTGGGVETAAEADPAGAAGGAAVERADAEEVAAQDAVGDPDAPERAAPTVAAATASPRRAVLERAWFEGARLRLARSFRGDGGYVLPEQVDGALLDDLELPDGWRFVPQQRGVVALQDARGGWLLLVPLVDDDALAWLCVAATPVDGCRVAVGGGLEAEVYTGSIGPASIIVALGRTDAELVERIAAQIPLPVDEPPPAASPPPPAPEVPAEPEAPGGGELLAQAEAAAGRGETDRARALIEEAVGAYGTAGDGPGVIAALTRLARLDALDPSIPTSQAARALLRCRQIVRAAGATAARCPGPGDLGIELERSARSGGAAADDPRWGRVRWWYEQGVAERDGYSARGLARILAFGLGGPIERDRALGLLQEAARDWDSFGEAAAAASAAQFSTMWLAQEGPGPDAGQASWWASQGARLGHVGSALRLAGAFAIGSGTARDLDRARELVRVYRDFTPLFEVAFYRSVGQRLAAGSDPDIEADPAAGRAWMRRAFALCSELHEAGEAEAGIELAGMYYSGEGTEKDVARAAELYADALTAMPEKAGNMLAWIRATHPDPALRDGDEAVRLARAVVAAARDPDYYDTLAAALAERGDFAEAARTQREALELLDSQGDPALAGGDLSERRALLVERLRSYEASRPWRDLDDSDENGNAGAAG